MDLEEDEVADAFWINVEHLLLAPVDNYQHSLLKYMGYSPCLPSFLDPLQSLPSIAIEHQGFRPQYLWGISLQILSSLFAVTGQRDRAKALNPARVAIVSAISGILKCAH
uniref:Uncharacterized protein n=2 Tax=Spongospora subterranea TaxID=70186 RepID=A0A0H5QFJ8_9EUKA|eukprot:CRZ00813.1 hypothetical protein [Spongospora subterranea]